MKRKNFKNGIEMRLPTVEEHEKNLKEMQDRKDEAEVMDTVNDVLMKTRIDLKIKNGGGDYMGVIERENIVGYNNVIGLGLMVCPKCIPTEQEQEVTEDQIITIQDIENDEERIYFCGECGHKL